MTTGRNFVRGLVGLAVLALSASACADGDEPVGDGQVVEAFARTGNGAWPGRHGGHPRDGRCRSRSFEGRDYLFCSRDETWEAARRRCFDAGMDLATIESEGENDFIRSHVSDHSFVGGTDAEAEGRFVWSATGEDFWSGGPGGSAIGNAYENWARGEPSGSLRGRHGRTHGSGEADCVVIRRPDGAWDATSCRRPTRGFVCEKHACGACEPPRDPCLAKFCDERVGECLTYPRDGVACRDGDPTTHGESCVAGVCMPPPTPADGAGSFCGADEMYEAGLESRAFREQSARGERVARSQEALEGQEPETLALENLVTIPVVFQVLEYANMTPITDAFLTDVLLAGLNEGFSDLRLDEIVNDQARFREIASNTRFRFELARRSPTCGMATGIVRTPTTNIEMFTGSVILGAIPAWADPTDGGAAPWPNDKYLNIWLARIRDAEGGARMPPDPTHPGDGVVLRTTLQGELGTPNDNRVDALVMEVAHWLNLHHTERPNDRASLCGVTPEGTCTGTTSATCSSEGDQVCDTPSLLAGFDDGACALRNTCTDTEDAAAGFFEDFDNDQNYLYQCGPFCDRVMFTAGQVTRMEATLFGIRSEIVSSDGAIPPPAVTTGDGWISDGYLDVGNQPNQETEIVWQSGDIWVRLQADGTAIQQHENPLFRPGEPNRVYVRVRNRGCSSAPATSLTLRWAKASTNLGWPSPWDGSRFVDGTNVPLGGTIGTEPVPALDPGASTIVEFEWEPPNPEDYEGVDADSTHFCLLSHLGDVSTAQQDLVTFVRSSNDIAWKNVTVSCDPDSTSCAEAAELRAVTIEGEADGAPTLLEFREPAASGSPASLFDWGIVRVDLGTALFERWVLGGMLGTGIGSVDGTVVTLAGSGATLANIPLAAGELFTLRIRFDPKDQGTVRRRRADVYLLDTLQFAQRSEEPPVPTVTATSVRLDLVGGMRFVLKTRVPLPISGIPDPQ
jgi:hypothetical protein